MFNNLFFNCSCCQFPRCKYSNMDDFSLPICHWTWSWKAMWTVGSGELVWPGSSKPLLIFFWNVIRPWLLQYVAPCFIFYRSGSSFSPFFVVFISYCAPNFRLNWELNFSSLYPLPWHFLLLSCLLLLLYHEWC